MPNSAHTIVQNAIDACSLAHADVDAGDEQSTASFLSTFEELGFDSLALMEFCISIHIETGIEISVEDLMNFGTPDAVVAFLKERL